MMECESISWKMFGKSQLETNKAMDGHSEERELGKYWSVWFRKKRQETERGLEVENEECQGSALTVVPLVNDDEYTD
mgnify:CR=1 FL=1